VESIDPLDKWLDPPELPDHMACDNCSEVFPEGDLSLVGGPGDYRYLCADCMIDEGIITEEGDE
jgi:hypothetical protein